MDLKNKYFLSIFIVFDAFIIQKIYIEIYIIINHSSRL